MMANLNRQTSTAIIDFCSGFPLGSCRHTDGWDTGSPTQYHAPTYSIDCGEESHSGHQPYKGEGEEGRKEEDSAQ